LLLSTGTPKKRFSLPNSRILIHQPSMSGLSGQATDIDIHAKEILRMRSVINQLMADDCGQSIEKIEQDVERDFIMSAQQAKGYGLIDEIIHKHHYGVLKSTATPTSPKTAGRLYTSKGARQLLRGGSVCRYPHRRECAHQFESVEC